MLGQVVEYYTRPKPSVRDDPQLRIPLSFLFLFLTSYGVTSSSSRSTHVSRTIHSPPPPLLNPTIHHYPLSPTSHPPTLYPPILILLLIQLHAIDVQVNIFWLDYVNDLYLPVGFA